MEDIKVNGVPIFDNLNDAQKLNIGKTIQQCPARARQGLLLTARDVANRLGVRTAYEFTNVLEIVKADQSSKWQKIALLSWFGPAAFEPCSNLVCSAISGLLQAFYLKITVPYLFQLREWEDKHSKQH